MLIAKLAHSRSSKFSRIQRPATRASIPALKPLPIQSVKITGGFLKSRIDTNRRVTLPVQYRNNQRTGALDGYQWDWWDPAKGLPKFHLWVGDVAKWIEAASYSQMTSPNAALAAKIEDAVARILRGQKEDGYLYAMPLPRGSRWGNLQEYHELYDLGHLIEAAVAHFDATGKRHFLDAICRATDLVCDNFGERPGQIRGCDGHPEFELALVKLYRATGNKRYLEQARFQVDVRGTKPNYFDIEAPLIKKKNLHFLNWFSPEKGTGGYVQCQAHMPLRKQRHAAGHAVRALYLYSGAADVAAETGDRQLLQACRRLWKSIVQKRMYVIGSVGSLWHGERFTFDYDLPNETAYNETCAAVALVFFAQRMLNIDKDAQYADVMERALYNGVLSGVSLDGRRFFYANRLANFPDKPNNIEEKISDHVAHTRQKWFGCACCPPNLSRLLSSLGSYMYSSSSDALFIHLYGESRCETQMGGRSVVIRQQTNYPWKESVAIHVDPQRPARFSLMLRIPGWLRPGTATIRLNGKALRPEIQKGYARIEALWKPGDRVELTLPMPVEQVEANPNVRMNCGKVALQRGPVVYCLEECDNGKNLADISIAPDARFKPAPENDLGSAMSITATALRRDSQDWQNQLYGNRRSRLRMVRIKAIPYCLWNNRGGGEMLVWLHATR